jgi:hypothetical protein
VLLLAAPIAALALLVVLFLKERPLQATHGHERPATRPGRPPLPAAAERAEL